MGLCGGLIINKKMGWSDTIFILIQWMESTQIGRSALNQDYEQPDQSS